MHSWYADYHFFFVFIVLVNESGYLISIFTLCCAGEHTDWAGEYRDVNPSIGYGMFRKDQRSFLLFCYLWTTTGMTVVCATNEGLYAKCSCYSPGKLLYEHYDAKSDRLKQFETSLDVNELKASAAAGGFYSYIVGTAAAIMEYLAPKDIAGPILPANFGIRINNYRTTLPMQKGLSSSAAVCVLVARSFNAVLNLDLPMGIIMELAYKGEMNTPSRCGRMDQVMIL
jgi:galactokinase